MIGLFKVVSRMADRVAEVANACGTLVVLGLVAVVNYDVIGRETERGPFMGAVELVQFSMVLIVFLQLPDVVRVNRMTRSDGFLAITSKRWPGFSRFLSRCINLVACVFMTLIAIAIWPEFVDMWETKDFFGVPGVFTAPWWPIKLVIFLSAVLCSLLFAFKVLFGESTSTSAKASTSTSEA